jgi:ELWxxDGT repeat protein
VDDVNGSIPTAGLETACIPVAGPIGAIGTSLRLPFGQATNFTYRVQAFESDNCTGHTDTRLLSTGDEAGEAELFHDAAIANLYIKTNGPYKMVPLWSATGSGCDYNPHILEGLGLNSAGGPYIFQSVTNASFNTLQMSQDLSEYSAVDVFPTAAGVNKVKELLKVGNEAFAVLSSPNEFTHRIYKTNGTSSVELTPTIMVEGTDWMNQSGVMTKLIAFGTDLFFGFKETPSSDKILCKVSTLTGASDCSIHSTDYAEVDPFYTVATGIYYIGKSVSDGLFRLVYFDGTIHTPGLVTYASFSDFFPQTKVYKTSMHTHVVYKGSPNLLFYANGLNLDDTGIVSGHLEPIVAGHRLIVNDPSGMVWFVDGASGTDIDTWSGVTLDTVSSGMVNNSLFHAVENNLYFLSDRGSWLNGMNVMHFNLSTGTLTQLTFQTLTQNTQAAVLNNAFYFIGTNGVNTALYKADGAGTPLLIKELDPSAYPSYGQMYSSGGKLYFEVFNTPNGKDIWVSDGTSAGTTLLIDSQSPSASSLFYQIGTVEDYFIFFANGTFYRSKGTIETTQMFLHPMTSGWTNLTMQPRNSGQRTHMFLGGSPNLWHFYIEKNP